VDKGTRGEEEWEMEGIEKLAEGKGKRGEGGMEKR